MTAHRTEADRWEPNDREWALIERTRAARTTGDIAGINGATACGIAPGNISERGARLLNKVTGMLLRDAEDMIRYGSPQPRDRETMPDPRQLLPQR